MFIAATDERQIATTRRSPWFRRRWVVWLMALVTLPTARAERAAITEADRTDPGWRTADIEAARAVVPDAENAALVVQRSAELMAPTIPYAGVRPGSVDDRAVLILYQRVHKLDPTAAMDHPTAAAYAEGLRPYAATVAEAMRLAGMRRGRYPTVARGPNFWSRPPHMESIRDIVRLLDADATLAADRGDADAAILDCRAILGAAASLGDEPGQLAADARLDAIAAIGSMPTGRLGRLLNPRVAALLPGRGGPLLCIGIRYARAQALVRANEAVALAERPSHEQSPLWAARGRRLAASQAAFPGALVDAAIVPFVLPGWNMAEVFYSTNAEVRAARIAIALERFRLKLGRWHADADELAMPGGLPDDPFVDALIEMKREADGWTLYSVGANGVDQGGKLGKARFPTVDVGIRLFLFDLESRPRIAP